MMKPRKLVIDEGVPRCIWQHLRDDGYTLILAHELGSGLSDEGLIAYASLEQAVIITRDHGLGHRVVWQRLPTATVVWLDVNGIPRDEQPTFVAERLSRGVAGPGMYSIRGTFQPRLSSEYIKAHNHLWKAIDA